MPIRLALEWRWILLPIVILFPAATKALTANVEANGFSFSLAPAATNAGITLFFTSFDGSSGIPLRDCDGVVCTLSQEVAPASIGSRTYRTDYFAVDAVGVFEFGTVSIEVDANDGDSDGILDPLERTRFGNFTFRGTATPDFNSFNSFVTSNVSGSVQRSANSLVGTYSGSFSNPSRTAAFAGSYSLSGASGSLAYELGGDVLEWNLTQRGLSGALRTFSGISTYTRNGSMGISTPSFALFDSDSGLSLFVDAATLARVGTSNVFRGTVTLADGGTETSWADFTTYRVEVMDSNDTDADGVPDLLSLPEANGAVASIVAIVALALVRISACKRSGGPNP